MSRSKSPNDYKVGYRKPPKASQFKPGQSGNKKGRPKKNKENIDEIFERRLDRKITGKVDGHDVSLTVREAIVETAIRSALKGDHRCLKMVFEHMGQLGDNEPADYEPPYDAKERLAQMLLRRAKARPLGSEATDYSI